MYYNFKEKVSSIPSHRLLAIMRGEREKVLRLSLEIPEASAINHLSSLLIKNPNSATADILQITVKDCLERLLLPATETEVRKDTRDRSDSEAITVFSENLEALLLSAPAGRKAVLGVDPGFRTDVSCCVDDNENKIDNTTIYPHEPHKQKKGVWKKLQNKFLKYKPSNCHWVWNSHQETDDFIKSVIKELRYEKLRELLFK
jgi:uncharacterized protein